jgi:hypothetical protein
MSLEDKLNKIKTDQIEAAHAEALNIDQQLQEKAQTKEQNIENLQQQIILLDRKIDQYQAWLDQAEKLKGNLITDQKTASQAAQQEVSTHVIQAEQETAAEYDERLRKYGPDVLKEAGIKDVVDYRNRLDQDEEEQGVYDRVEKRASKRSDRPSEQKLTATTVELAQVQAELQKNFPDLDFENAYDQARVKVAEEIANLAQGRQELFAQTPAGREEIKTQLHAELIKQRPAMDFYLNYDRRLKGSLVRAEDIKLAAEYGEEEVKQSLREIHEQQIATDLESKKQAQGVDLLPELRDLQDYPKKLESAEAKVTELREVYQETKEYLTNNQAQLMLGAQLNDKYDGLQDRVKWALSAPDLSRRYLRNLDNSMKSGHLEGAFPIKLANLDRLAKETDFLTRALQDLRGKFESDPEYWQRFQKAGNARGGGSPFYNEGVERLALQSDFAEPEEDKVSTPLVNSLLQSRSLDRLAQDLTQKEQLLEKEAAEKRKNVDEQFEFAWAEQKAAAFYQQNREVLERARELKENKADALKNLTAIQAFAAQHAEQLSAVVKAEIIKGRGSVWFAGLKDKKSKTTRDLQEVRAAINQKTRDLNQLGWLGKKIKTEKLRAELTDLELKKSQLEALEQKSTNQEKLANEVSRFIYQPFSANRNSTLSELTITGEKSVQEVLSVISSIFQEVAAKELSSAEQAVVDKYQELAGQAKRQDKFAG